MNKIDAIVSKLNLMGSKTEIISNKALLIHGKEDEIKGYTLGPDDKLSLIDYDIDGYILNTRKYIRASKGSNVYLLNRNLEVILKFSGERPVKLIYEYFIELNGIVTNTKRIIGIDGRAISGMLAWSLKVKKLTENKIVILEHNNSYTSVIIGEYDLDSLKSSGKELLKLDLSNEVVFGLDSFLVKLVEKPKVLMYDYTGRILLSVPGGSIEEKENYIILDKTGKVIKTVKR